MQSGYYSKNIYIIKELLRKKQYKNAEHELKSIHDYQTNDGLLYVNAECQMGLGNWNSALEFSKKDEDYSRRTNNKGQLYKTIRLRARMKETQGEYSEAIKIYNNLLESRDLDTISQLLNLLSVSICHRKNNDKKSSDEVLTVLGQGIHKAFEPAWKDIEAKQYAKAEKTLQSLDKLFPRTDTCIALAVLDEKKADYTSALIKVEHAIKMANKLKHGKSLILRLQLYKMNLLKEKADDASLQEATNIRHELHKLYSNSVIDALLKEVKQIIYPLKIDPKDYIDYLEGSVDKAYQILSQLHDKSSAIDQSKQKELLEDAARVIDALFLFAPSRITIIDLKISLAVAKEAPEGGLEACYQGYEMAAEKKDTTLVIKYKLKEALFLRFKKQYIDAIKIYDSLIKHSAISSYSLSMAQLSKKQCLKEQATDYHHAQQLAQQTLLEESGPPTKRLKLDKEEKNIADLRTSVSLSNPPSASSSTQVVSVNLNLDYKHSRPPTSLSRVATATSHSSSTSSFMSNIKSKEDKMTDVKKTATPVHYPCLLRLRMQLLLLLIKN